MTNIKNYIPKNSKEFKFHVFKDGDMFCAVLPDFKDLQESPSGFGQTEWHAIMDLISQAEVGSIAYELL